MSFWGVFCFFLPNPFSLLSVFVPKEEIIYFVNIMVILKLTLCSFTAAFYFRYCKKTTSRAITVSLSLMYALCGYGMLFYQNIMWLDIMYLVISDNDNEFLPLLHGCCFYPAVYDGLVYR